LTKRKKQQALKQPKRKQRERNRINQQLCRAAANLEAAKKNKGNLEAILVSNRANEDQKQKAREILKQLEPKEPIDGERLWQIYVQQKEAERLKAEEAKTPEQAEKEAQERAQQAARQARIADLKEQLVIYHTLLNMPSSLWPKYPQSQLDEWRALSLELSDLEHPPTPQELKQRAAAQSEKQAKEAVAKAARQARIDELTAKLAPYRAIFKQPSGYWPRITKGLQDYWDGLEKELADLLDLENQRGT
jgi:hypothetical protein